MYKKCSACKKQKLWFRIKKRTYSGPKVVTGKLTSDTEICKRCHENAKLLILGQKSLRHYKDHVIIKLKQKIHDTFRTEKAI